jgi:hypothetical protein
MLVHTIVHVDAYESLRNGVESDPIGLVEVTAVTELVAFPVIQAWAVVEVVVILKLFFGNWAVWRRWSRLAGEEVIHLVVVVWESNIHASTSTISVLVKENELRIFVPPHREPKTEPAAVPVVIRLHFCEELQVRAEGIAPQADKVA